MSSTDGDHADVIAPPPLIFLCPLLLGLGLQHLAPLPSLPRWSSRLLGGLLIVGGAAIVFSGVRTMRRAGTPVDPRQSVTSIVSSGPFARTRNPLYLSLAAIYTGVALIARSGWSLLFLPGVLAVMQRGVIEREERYLEAKFGDEYVRYKQRVSRWI